jgi:hypothetical protein
MIRKAVLPAAAVLCLAAPAVAGARPADTAANVDPLPECVKVVVQQAPGFVISTVENFVENGELPRIMGPFLPC